MGFAQAQSPPKLAVFGFDLPEYPGSPLAARPSRMIALGVLACGIDQGSTLRTLTYPLPRLLLLPYPPVRAWENREWI